MMQDFSFIFFSNRAENSPQEFSISVRDASTGKQSVPLASVTTVGGETYSLIPNENGTWFKIDPMESRNKGIGGQICSLYDAPRLHTIRNIQYCITERGEIIDLPQNPQPVVSSLKVVRTKQAVAAPVALAAVPAVTFAIPPVVTGDFGTHNEAVTKPHARGPLRSALSRVAKAFFAPLRR